jgi:hypothetical protein
MAARKLRTASTEISGAKPAWDPSENTAVAELLDHIAEELAREYVRLMEEAGKDDSTNDQDDGPGSG